MNRGEEVPPPVVLTIRSSWRIVPRLTIYYSAIAGLLVGAAIVGGSSGESTAIELALYLAIFEGIVVLFCAAWALADSAIFILYRCRSLVVRIDESTVVASSRRGVERKFPLASDEILINLPPRWPEFYLRGDTPEFAQVYIISYDFRGDKAVFHLGQVLLYGSLYRRWLRENESTLRAWSADLKPRIRGVSDMALWLRVRECQAKGIQGHP